MIPPSIISQLRWEISRLIWRVVRRLGLYSPQHKARRGVEVQTQHITLIMHDRSRVENAYLRFLVSNSGRPLRKHICTREWTQRRSRRITALNPKGYVCARSLFPFNITLDLHLPRGSRSREITSFLATVFPHGCCERTREYLDINSTPRTRNTFNWMIETISHVMKYYVI